MPHDPSPASLRDRAREAYSVQDYRARSAIEGVQWAELRRFHDDGGSMTELARLTEGLHKDLAGFVVRQVNYSEMEPGAIKAFHLHMRQTDVWFVPPDCKMLAVLGDARKGSATEGNVQRLVLGDGTSRLLRIPPGVAHGVRNIAPSRGRLLYFVDVNFDPQPDRCDEGRLPWDHFGAEVWEIAKG
jgi:dTDP-4-dehydrorhamnose 3,5-epimerase